MGRDSGDGIATHYRLDGPGIKYQWQQDFPHLSRQAVGPPSLPYNGYRVFSGRQAAGRSFNHPTPSNAEAKERIELYFYTTSGTSCLVLR